MSAAQRVKNRKILVVDDDPDSLEIVTETLKWDGYQVKSASDGSKVLPLLEEWQPDVILLDVNMPELNGLDVLKMVRRRNSYVSVMFVTGNNKTEEVITGLDAGADDYICKPFDPREMLARIRTQLRIKDLNDQLLTMNVRLRELVNIDDLTGLYNMRSLYQKLDHEMARGKRFKRSVCAVMMDMDYFKTVNDAHDHLFGSFVLSKVGEIIKENIRSVDFGARYGGDEFLIVLTEVDYAGAQLFCERLRERIENYNFKNETDEMRLTASIGFGLTSAGESEMTSKELVRWADTALYEAKNKGRNKVVGYDLGHEQFRSEKQKPPKKAVVSRK